ncbi:MAG: hypothetical protein ACRDOK_22235, partial [Streptosporangiaceae bacterium]
PRSAQQRLRCTHRRHSGVSAPPAALPISRRLPAPRRDLNVYVADVEQERIYCRVAIHENADVAAAQKFWQQVTALPDEQFLEPTLKHHNPKTVRKNTGNDYHGCLVIHVRKGLELYRQIEGWAGAAMGSRSLSE